MLVKLDAAFEAVLGVVLLLGIAAGTLRGSDFSVPTGLVGAAAILLLAFGAAIWSGLLGLRALALGNAVGAVAGIGWLLVDDGLSATGTVVVAVVVACLGGLSAAQAATLRA